MLQLLEFLQRHQFEFDLVKKALKIFFNKLEQNVIDQFIKIHIFCTFRKLLTLPTEQITYLDLIMFKF